MEYNPDDIEAIEGLFRRLTDADSRAVVPRGHRNLPEQVPGGDIDIIVHRDDYETVIEHALEAGFTAEYSQDRETAVPGRERSEWKGRYGDVIVHLKNIVAYPSPTDSSETPVDPAVEDLLFENRRVKDGIPIPAPPDELAHLVCRGTFAKDGGFPDHYEDRCDLLADRVFSTETQRRRFERLLGLLFSDAAEDVTSHIKNSEYEAVQGDVSNHSDVLGP